MKVVAMCTLSSGLSTIKLALEKGVKIKKIIGLDNINNREKNKISGMVDISKFCYQII